MYFCWFQQFCGLDSLDSCFDLLFYRSLFKVLGDFSNTLTAMGITVTIMLTSFFFLQDSDWWSAIHFLVFSIDSLLEWFNPLENKLYLWINSRFGLIDGFREDCISKFEKILWVEFSWTDSVFCINNSSEW